MRCSNCEGHYELRDARDYRVVSLEEHITNGLGMQTVVSDPALYDKLDSSTLIDVGGIQIDNSLNVG